MQEPYTLAFEIQTPEGTDFNEDYEKIRDKAVLALEASGHVLQRIDLQHGSFRGGAKTWKHILNLDAPKTDSSETLESDDIAKIAV